MLSTLCRKHLPFIMSFFLFTLITTGQNITQTDTLNSKDKRAVMIHSDSSKVSQGNIKEEVELTKSPMGALWRSFILPGWGQIYVENYWKAPIFIAGLGASVYFIVWNNNKFNYYQSQYDELKQNEPENTLALDKLMSQKEYYRDNRDKSYFLLGVTYILAAIDAYVGANLFDFNVNDNLNMRLMPFYDNHFGMNFSFHLK